MSSHPFPRHAPARTRAGAWPALVALALAVPIAALAPAAARPATAQETKAAPPATKGEVKKEAPRADEPRKSAVSNGQGLRLTEPVPFRVYQRDRDGRADITLTLDPGVEDARVVSASLSAPGIVEGARFEDGKLLGVPTGGPYTINAAVRVGSTQFQVSAANVFVGDLWVLAGQSNMEGVGDLIEVTNPNPVVQLLGMDGAWSNAKEPLHWLVDSPDPVHSGNPADRVERSARQHKTRAKGAGLGLPFAAALYESTRVPIGLVATAHGGTSMAQWDPAKKGDGGKSLYGSFLRQVNLAGGKVKGVLWYQGESDANPEAAKIFPKVFADFIDAVRSDLGQPELPFYYVQIGRFIRGGDSKPWNAVQDAQRTLAERVPNTAVVAVIDLELDDLIHVGTQGLKRAGRRLARVAERELFGLAGGTTPTLDRVNKGASNTLVVKFKGVNIAPRQAAPVAPFGSFPAATASPHAFPDLPSQAGGSGPGVVGLKPNRHIAGFSVRKDDGTEIPLIFDAAVGNARDTVVLKLTGPLPEKAFLWYGHGYDPSCNLTDGLDMAVPVFGPIPLDEVK